VQEIRIVNDGVDVAPGAEGEIWVRGPSVVSGYLDDSELNAAAFTADGWLRTGDVGYLDEDGFLFLTGRLKELINRGGAKISPTEVDAVLLAHPGVNEAASFAAPDERLGEDIVAAVIAVEGATLSPRELRTWMLDRLVPHKVPRRIWFVDDLPRTPTGKVQRGELARRWHEEHGEDGPETSRIDPERA
jgi:acyl-CoA synthetase (AMP-forming)/AMP-acid ligase II